MLREGKSAEGGRGVGIIARGKGGWGLELQNIEFHVAKRWAIGRMRNNAPLRETERENRSEG